MSDIDFPVNLPPIPTPKVSPDEGIPSIPSASIGQVAVSGSSSTNEIVVPHGENIQQGQSGYIFRQFSGTMSVADSGGNATVTEFRNGIEGIYNNLPSTFSGSARYGDIITLVNSVGGAFQGRFLRYRSSQVAREDRERRLLGHSPLALFPAHYRKS